MKVFLKEKMSKHTSFRIGGEADVFVVPESVEELKLLIKYLRENNIIYYIVGRGTNLLVSDSGLRGCVVNIGKELSKIKVRGTKLEAEAGAQLIQIADEALNNGLTGFEELSGIPGTIGGAITMNAGAYDRTIDELVISCDVINEDNKIITINKKDLDFSYRHSIIEEKGYIVTKVSLRLTEGNKQDILNKMNQIKTIRQTNQPLEYPSAGSVFKRPENSYASLLIEESGLKGERVGDAQVSEKHSGFIVNLGNATEKDVYKLITKIKKTIKTYYNIDLETEIKMWGKL